VAAVSAFLDRGDVIRITGRRKYLAQRRELVLHGYVERRHFIVAATGEPLVFANMVENDRPKAAANVINWDALRKRERSAR